MESIYLLISSDDYLLKTEVDKILLELKHLNHDVLFYDASEIDVKSLIQELRTVSLFDEGKTVVLKNVEAFSKTSEDELKMLQNYLSKPVEHTVLIMTTHAMKDIGVLKELVEKYAFINEIRDLNETEVEVFCKVKLTEGNFTVDAGVVNALLNISDKTDLFLLSQEIDKLRTYRQEEKHITISDVYELVNKSFDDTIYDLSTAMIEHKTEVSMQVFNDLVTKNVDPLTILNHLINKMQEIKYTQILMAQSKTKEDVSNFFRVSAGRAFYMTKNAKQLSAQIVERFMIKMSQLDYEIKSGKIDKKIGLELLILGGI